MARAVVAVARAAGAVDRVCLGSFGRTALRAARAMEPAIATSAAREEVRWALYRSWCRWPVTACRLRRVSGAGAGGPHARGLAAVRRGRPSRRAWRSGVDGRYRRGRAALVGLGRRRADHRPPGPDRAACTGAAVCLNCHCSTSARTHEVTTSIHQTDSSRLVYSRSHSARRIDRTDHQLWQNWHCRVDVQQTWAGPRSSDARQARSRTLASGLGLVSTWCSPPPALTRRASWNTSSIIAGVSLPVLVFCRLGW